MKKIGSYLIILLLITAYGRCIAVQMGAFQNSDVSCCQSLSCDSNLANHDESNSEHNENNQDEPCHLCFILSSDSLLPQENLEIPSLSPYYLTVLWNDLFIEEPKFGKMPLLDMIIAGSGYPTANQEHRALQQRITNKRLPARGPSSVIS